MDYLKAYNQANDIKFFFDLYTNRISPRDFAIELINISINNSPYMFPNQKEIYKALISSAKYV